MRIVPSPHPAARRLYKRLTTTMQCSVENIHKRLKGQEGVTQLEGSIISVRSEPNDDTVEIERQGHSLVSFDDRVSFDAR